VDLAPAHAPTKSEAAYASLLRAIRTGELRAGERITLTTLATQLEMSLTPVRDALALLAEQGLVTRKPNHVTVVNQPTRERSAEVSMIRALLEPEAARLAAVRADQPGLGRLAAACEAMEAAVAAERPEGIGDLNARFHLMVGELSGSDLLAEFIGRLWNQIPLEGLTATRQLAKAAREHRAILGALQRGDAGGAQVLMSDHIGHAAVATDDFLAELG
jgi:DNA-binding GntR family transcriptional regulator